MRRKIVRGLAIGALLLAFGTAAPATSVFAGQGGGGGGLHPGECIFQQNADGTYTVTIGQGPPNADGTATRAITTVQGNVPDGCRQGNLQGMDEIPIDGEALAFVN